jgi:hypothetical protein
MFVVMPARDAHDAIIVLMLVVVVMVMVVVMAMLIVLAA